MTKGRLEAFSDAVIVILITIIVLELKIPHGTDIEALRRSRCISYLCAELGFDMANSR